MARSSKLWPGAILGIGALAPAGCRAGGVASGKADGTRLALKPGPDVLARNAAQANQIVGEGPRDLRAGLAALKGQPVVVDQWASWCGDCRYELAFFNSAARRFGGRVALLGLDSQDNRADAVRYIRKTPGGFPTISDPDGSLARSLGGGVAFPTTFFLDRRGRRRAIHIGAYPSAAALIADVARYAFPKG